MHRSTLGIILVALTTWGAAQQAARTPADIARNTGQSVCLIATQDENGNLTGLGSGFVCANNRVATNFLQNSNAIPPRISLATSSRRFRACADRVRTVDSFDFRLLQERS